MPELAAQFAEALKNIEPTAQDKANAPLAHDQVSDALEADSVIQGWGFRRLLIGSYKRHVSIRRIKDVDVFGRLEESGATTFLVDVFHSRKPITRCE